MNLLNIVLIWFSGLSFLFYGVSYFTSQQIKDEFNRFGLEKFGALTGALEICGGLGILVGLKIHFILLISSGGLSILMLLGLGARIKVRDSFWQSFPALFFMLLNIYIFFNSIQVYQTFL